MGPNNYRMGPNNSLGRTREGLNLGEVEVQPDTELFGRRPGSRPYGCIRARIDRTRTDGGGIKNSGV